MEPRRGALSMSYVWQSLSDIRRMESSYWITVITHEKAVHCFKEKANKSSSQYHTLYTETYTSVETVDYLAKDTSILSFCVSTSFQLVCL